MLLNRIAVNCITNAVLLFFESSIFHPHHQNMITMKNVTLKFPSTHILWLFRRTINLAWLQVDPALRTLTCACNVEDINVALSSYGAEIVEQRSFLTQIVLDSDYNDRETRAWA